ncbi:hypothetical protein ONS95_012905 [Cadophora gregata]|uniref:uncharacterized protein n=1 Tax=Cadophora gregata TaxID=51156 RepID=UPI0026DC81B4|nr:uncharacterized protein ONS95_012905 [Cadophora gregata]KAK0101112.1 hypothetical protein ONS96_006339 [Cadophora gregata f. sp. sojae]KAK0115856.1 hypothetical protein ONS95_012905 [Cadophora gregata]
MCSFASYSMAQQVPSVPQSSAPARRSGDTIQSLARESSGARPRTRPYLSYKDYLDTNVEDWPEFRWMQVFFMHPGGDPNNTNLTIIDSANGSLHPQSITTLDPHSLTTALENRQPEVKTRIIVVHYGQSFSIDRRVVDILGSVYDLDPLVLQRHFEHDAMWLEDGLKTSKHIEELLPEARLALLPSEETCEGRFVHFGLSNFRYITAMYFNQKDKNDQTTVLIWLRFNLSIKDRLTSLGRGVYPSFSFAPKRLLGPGNKISAAYISMLLTWTPDLVRRGDDDSHQYLAPLLQLFLKIELYEFRNVMDPNLDRYVDHDIDGTLTGVRMNLASLKRTKKAFREFNKTEIGRQHQMSPNLLDTALSELESLISDYEEAEAAWNSERRDELLDAQLKEARKSTETALRVASLTRLAVVFIPLSFVASVFGMNIQQFNDGKVSLSAFFGTAAIMSFLTFLPILGLIDKEITVANIKLFGRSPLHGFWLLAFTLSHFRKSNRALCEERLLYFLSSGRRPNFNRDPNLEDENFWMKKFGWVTPGRWQRFWIGRVLMITKFIEREIDREGWRTKKGFLDKILGDFGWWQLER